ncbi:MAG: hypothetical protein EOR99_29435 [Mesorhizobium sp.]|nr:hypothetical protein EOD08_14605 [Mesorhizobium sp. M6A.T.Ca.TU.002.02.2.1]RUU99002.1 hypothetical protein EOB36_21925 [Mesorhizobium sp. M6A.T.Cr.TU.017.01.1.1]RVB72611.1 hypothetical protein EN885_28590 [Mesorhizobium sp. M6A.T.Cr.TU.014.01.1.1]RWN42104.1 MAG: hypothetical protein EOR96_10980 [Mesorhizobium sp.]RWN62200.1 MAG: hypothetical protein EOR99_29435 [Mesorhizobium sp.]
MIRFRFFAAMRQNGLGLCNFGLVNASRVDKIALPPPGMAGEYETPYEAAMTGATKE